MPSPIEERLAALGIALPPAAAPAANYAPFQIAGNQVIVSGQLPMENGRLAVKGKLGGGVSIEDGQRAARLCALNLLAQVKAAAGGSLDRRVRCLRLGGFVASTPDFLDQPKVVNGASDLMAAVLGDDGRHARAAVGVAVLPFDAAVEVEGLFELG
jgi:enamine deaminase RidA (YjgF/YER057c/UK114 family)